LRTHCSGVLSVEVSSCFGWLALGAVTSRADRYSSYLAVWDAGFTFTLQAEQIRSKAEVARDESADCHKIDRARFNAIFAARSLVSINQSVFGSVMVLRSKQPASQ
jgi:hypothetical protein